MMRRKISLTQQIIFWQTLVDLSKASISLYQSLEISRSTLESIYLQRTIDQLQQDLMNGLSLSESLTQSKSLNSSFNVQMIKLAENTGDYPHAFMLIVQHLKWKQSWRQLVQQSIRYPIILMVLLIVLMMIIILLVLPGLLDQLKMLGVQNIPWATKILIFIGQYPTQIFSSLACAGIFLIIGRFFNKARGLKPWRYRIPKLGRLLYQLQMIQFLHTLGVMLSAKIDILSGIYHAAQAPNCLWLTKRLQEKESQVIAGQSLSSALADILPKQSPTANLIGIGEITGNLGHILVTSCDAELSQLQTKLRNWLDLLQPALVMLMGFIMIWVVLAVLLPLYESLGKFNG